MCFNPRKLIVNGKPGLFGCGHCLQCLKQYQDMWTARLFEESKSWHRLPSDDSIPIVFFTLKYRDDTVPKSYLNLTENGFSVSDSPLSGVPVLDFWTTYTRESGVAWLFRRDALLREYSRYFRIAVAGGVAAAKYEEDVESEDSWKNFKIRHPYYRTPESDLPDFECQPTFRFSEGSKLSHLFNSSHDLLRRSRNFTDDEADPLYSRPLCSCEFLSVRKTDVTSWLKRSRRRFERNMPSPVNGVSPRFNKYWIDSKGVRQELPSSACTKTFKYFITSEYGPHTHRPHMHGVLFGVTYDEFEKYFAPDWIENFGSVDYSAYDSTRGAFTYVSKYCAKGCYEHPYCKKDFFYDNGKEYHSNRYEESIVDFGVDAALVKPTFHLISKGIGVRYAFQFEVQNYFGVELLKFVSESGNVRYVCSDSVCLCVHPSTPIEDSTRSLRIEPTSDGVWVRKYGYVGYDKLRKDPFAVGPLIGESFIPADSIVNTALEELLLNKRYHRTYVSDSKKNPVGRKILHPVCVSCWHKIGLPVLEAPKVSTTEISLPRYYRQWLVSPLASVLRSCAAKRLHPDLDETIAGILRSDRTQDEKDALVESLKAADALRVEMASSRLRRSAQRFYFSRSGCSEID